MNLITWGDAGCLLTKCHVRERKQVYIFYTRNPYELMGMMDSMWFVRRFWEKYIS